jgi:hypothetical protein
MSTSLILDSETDEAACDLASELLSRSQCSSVEVRRGARLIFQIRRPGSTSCQREMASETPLNYNEPRAIAFVSTSRDRYS